jgi:phosphoglycolate phosphatase
VNQFTSFKSLKEFTHHKEVTIACHNFPDADTIASAYALYSYFILRSNAKVRIVYGGISPVTKTNLTLMLKLLHIPLKHVTDLTKVDGLLITVDCQYLSGNVIDLCADEIVIIDHHRLSRELVAASEKHNKQIYTYICETYGSCSTVVYELLQRDDFLINKFVSTALYYGLYMDTNEFSELKQLVDIEMKESLKIDSSIFSVLRNSNLTKDELIIAGHALKDVVIHQSFAYIKAQECDPNMLGLLADMLIMVENVCIAVVYTQISSPDLTLDLCYKFSVRTCVESIPAHDFAEKLVSPSTKNGTDKKIGYAGGHITKAGGSIDKYSFLVWCNNEHKKYNDLSNYLCESFDNFMVDKEIYLGDDYILEKATGTIKQRKN